MISWIQKVFGAAVLGAMMLTAAGCLRDNEDKIAPERGPEAPRETLTVSVRIPEMQTATRAVDETVLDDVEVLLFTWDADPSNQEYVGALTPKILNNENGIMQFSIPKPDLAAYELVLVANDNFTLVDIFEEAIAAGDTEGVTKDVLESMVFNMGKGGSLILLNDLAPDIPMYGESGRVDGSSDEVISVNMIRMVAKMSLKMADAASDINEIVFHNFNSAAKYRNAGYSSFSPNPVYYKNEQGVESGDNDYFHESTDYSDITSATMPITSTGDMYVYEAQATSDDDYLNGAYLLVQAKYKEVYYWYRINLISDGTVGGTAKGDYLPIVRNYDYKITINGVKGRGFETAELAAETKNTVSNLDYTVFALDNDMFTEGGEFSPIFYDGNYFLALSDGTVYVGEGVGADYAGTFEVFTNYNYLMSGEPGADEWTMTPADGDNWFAIAVSEGTAATVNGTSGMRYTVTVTPTEALPTGPNYPYSSRDGYIDLAVGKVDLKDQNLIRVSQSERGWLDLRLLPEPATTNTVRIVSWNGEKIIMGPSEFQIAAMWNTPDGEIKVTNVPTAAPGGEVVRSFPYVSTEPYDSWGNNETQTFTGGSHIFNIKPEIPTSEGSVVRRSLLTFSDTSGATEQSVDVMYRDLWARLSDLQATFPSREYLRMCLDANVENYINLDANTDTDIYPDDSSEWPSALFSRPIAQWSGKAGDETSDPTYAFKVDGYADPFSANRSTGKFFYYIFGETKTRAQLGADSVVVKFKLRSVPYPATSDYPAAATQTASYDIVIYPMLEQANSYIAETNTMLGAIPTPQLNPAVATGYEYDDVPASYTFHRVKILWSDRPGVIEDVSMQGSGPKAGIFVKTGNVEGNAVIAMYNNLTGTILWSWHIWVTDDKDTIEAGMTGHTDWMDRNLGALAADWGAATSPTWDVKEDVYSRLFYQWGRKDPFIVKSYLGGNSNNPHVNYVEDAYSGDMDITASVQNPMKYYTEGHWVDNEELWTPATGQTKSVYDPCPPGWRVPKRSEMPTDGTYTSNNTTGKIDFGGGFWLPTAGLMSGSGIYARDVYLVEEGFRADGYTNVFFYDDNYNKWEYVSSDTYDKYEMQSMYNVRCIREGERTATLTVSPTAWNDVAVTGGTKSDFTVTATNIVGALQVSDNADWLTSTISGTTLTLVASENEALARTATVTLSGGGKTATVTVTQKGVANLAAPGVIGYIKGTNELTLKGSKEYKDNAAVKAYAEANFYGLSDQTVYVAYFKFGSLVAISSDPTDDTAVNSKYIQADDILAAPSTTDGYQGLAALRSEVENQTTAQNAWDKIPYQGSTPNLLATDLDSGLGDPCAYYTNYFGDGWKLPTGNPYNGAPAYDTSNTTWYDAGQNNLPVAGRMSGRTTPDEAGMFYPAVGARTTNGQISSNVGTRGGYWSSNQYYFHFEDDDVSVPASTALSNIGYAVRCVPGPPATIEASEETAMFRAASDTKTFEVTTTNFVGTPTVTKNANWLDWSLNNGTLSLTTQTNTAIASRTTTVTLSAGSAAVVITVTQVGSGGQNHVLYFDGSTIKVGRWGGTRSQADIDEGIQVISDRSALAFFKFGSVVGFTNGMTNKSSFAGSSVKFNPTSTVLTTYAQITGYSSGDYPKNVSSSEYHNATNLALGKGDPCKLAGLSLDYIKTEIAAGRAPNSGWRLPTKDENRQFVGVAPDDTTGDFGTSSGYYSVSGSWTESSPGTGIFPANTAQAENPSLPTTGYHDNNGVMDYRHSVGAYWSSTPNTTSNGYRLYIGYRDDGTNNHVTPSSGVIAYSYGFAIRCVRD